MIVGGAVVHRTVRCVPDIDVQSRTRGKKRRAEEARYRERHESALMHVERPLSNRNAPNRDDTTTGLQLDYIDPLSHLVEVHNELAGLGTAKVGDPPAVHAVHRHAHIAVYPFHEDRRCATIPAKADRWTGDCAPGAEIRSRRYGREGEQSVIRDQ